MARARGTLEAGGFRPEPLQSPWVRANLNMPEELLLSEMRVLTVDGRLMGGADALVYMSRTLSVRLRPWWAWVLIIAGRIPFAMPVLRFAYARIAEHRYCSTGVLSRVPIAGGDTRTTGQSGSCPVRKPQAAGKERIQ